MPQFFEMLMIVSFGISWPLAISKSIKSRTNKGKSILFIVFILAGYMFGITSKIMSGKITYVFVFYCINFVMVACDIGLYIRNSKFDNKTSK